MSAPLRSEEALLQAVLKRAKSQRNSYLKRSCGEDDALRRRIEERLVARETTEPMPAAAPPQEDDTVQLEPSEGPYQQIGRYKLLKEIGAGGFGQVWRAEQAGPIPRRVALKVVKLGMDSRDVIAQFEAERQLLALMEHPNIAKVYDAGETEDGLPYFVMELVSGIPITRFCVERQLPTQERLRLFVQVCKALQHAHQKGVIHRDIKPSNILVSMNDGKPLAKVIDFGIAKAVHPAFADKQAWTAFEPMIGTPAYMSPEQVAGNIDIDTRCDIYALGVLLHELLVGRTPFDNSALVQAGPAKMRQILCGVNPPKPSSIFAALPKTVAAEQARQQQSSMGALTEALLSDLDWIVLKATQKDRNVRYETANGMAMDVERHLTHEPVVARPYCRTYRLKNW